MQPNPTADWYRRAATELAGTSTVQVRWAHAIAANPEAVALIEQLPREHRQPSLLFSVARYLGADASTDILEWLHANWPAAAAIAATRKTQTNEANRCAPLVAALAQLPDEPIALIEVGASAGLCLVPERYAYDFGAGVLGAGTPGCVARSLAAMLQPGCRGSPGGAESTCIRSTPATRMTGAGCTLCCRPTGRSARSG